MPKIPDHIIERVLDHADIVEVVGDFLHLRKTGVRYTAICPFHQDRHDGNFIVYPAGNCYKCFTCDAKGGVVDFLMNYCHMAYPDAIRWLGRKYNIETDNIPMNFTPPPPRPKPAPLPMLELPMHMVTSHEHTEHDTLCRWLRSLPWNTEQRTRLEKVLTEYHIGHARQGHTIFWQIDELDTVRTGKMMLYKADGHRDKETRYNFDWIHSLLFRDQRLTQYDDRRQECRPTLFGLHLLHRYPKATVHIVESEKTAVIMATAYGNDNAQVWMACGGAENLSRQKLAPIIDGGRRIILYPDRDAVDRWKAKAANIHYDRLTIDTKMVTDYWRPCDGDKADIADVVVRMICHPSQPASIGELIERHPFFGKIVEKLKLEEINGTEEQQQV